MADTARIVLTREREANRPWEDRLAAAGRDCAVLPLVAYTALPAPAETDFAGYDWVLFTSPQGVRAFAGLAPRLGEARLGALGHGTARAVAEAGWTVAFDPGLRDGAEFAAAFVATADAPARILMPGPERRITAPFEILAAAGHTVTGLPLYATGPVPAAEIAAAEIRPGDVLFFCSPSAVRAFAAARDDRPRCVAIGATTATACHAAGFDAAVADTPDLEAMVRAAGLEPLPAPESEPVQPERQS
ncbi:uroporphyrinogen-III synthase [bacterium]|nr:uroporphyrinogen-III synthase [bacterium]